MSIFFLNISYEIFSADSHKPTKKNKTTNRLQRRKQRQQINHIDYAKNVPTHIHKIFCLVTPSPQFLKDILQTLLQLRSFSFNNKNMILESVQLLQGQLQWLLWLDCNGYRNFFITTIPYWIIEGTPTVATIITLGLSKYEESTLIYWLHYHHDRQNLSSLHIA